MAVKTKTVHTAAVVGGDAKLEDWLDSKGVQWEFHPALDVDQFDADKSLHNQARFEPIDEKRVESYVEAMRRGDKFPPVLAHGRMGRLILADGNRQPPEPGLANTDTSPVPPNPEHPAGTPCASFTAPRTDAATSSWAGAVECAEGFLAGHRGATAMSYRSDVRDFYRWTAARGLMPLRLRRTDLDAYVTHLLEERRLAVTTVRRRLAVVNQLYVWAVDEGLLTSNPAGRMRRPRAQVPPPRVRLTIDEAAKLLRAAEQHSLRAAVLVHLLLLHGCRIGAVLAADRGDVEVSPAGLRMVVVTKGGGRQELHLGATTYTLVQQLVDGQDTGPLLRSASGRRWHRTNAARLLRAVAATVLDPAVASRLHPHALRRLFVDCALTDGVLLSELQFALGHRSSAMVLRYATCHQESQAPVAWRVAAVVAAGQHRPYDVEVTRSTASPTAASSAPAAQRCSDGSTASLDRADLTGASRLRRFEKANGQSHPGKAGSPDSGTLNGRRRSTTSGNMPSAPAVAVCCDQPTTGVRGVQPQGTFDAQRQLPQAVPSGEPVDRPGEPVRLPQLVVPGAGQRDDERELGGEQLVAVEADQVGVLADRVQTLHPQLGVALLRQPAGGPLSGQPASPAKIGSPGILFLAPPDRQELHAATEVH